MQNMHGTAETSTKVTGSYFFMFTLYMSKYNVEVKRISRHHQRYRDTASWVGYLGSAPAQCEKNFSIDVKV